MSDIPQAPNRSSIERSGGKIGVLILHDLLAAPANLLTWIDGLAAEGFTVKAPTLAGHDGEWTKLASCSWPDWYRGAERAFLELKSECERVFIAGHGVGGTLALRLSQIRGSEIEGTILLNTVLFEEGKSLSIITHLPALFPSLATPPLDCSVPAKTAVRYPRTPTKARAAARTLMALTEEDLYLVDLPLMVAYSVDDHQVHPTNSETIIDNVYSADIREVIFENSFHEVALDFDSDALVEETVTFIQDVLSGEVLRGESSAEIDERELIDAEFDAIVSGLGLDDHFVHPNPRWQKFSREIRPATIAISVGLIYITSYLVIGIDLLGLGAWPGILTFLGGIATLIWRSAKNDEQVDPDDGAAL